MPNPAGTTAPVDNELFAVRCLNARDCWAVGGYTTKNDVTHNQALHWNGKKWSNVAAPLPGGTADGDTSELFDSTCTSSRNCWAVGNFGHETTSSQLLLNEVLHWNGKRWSRVHIANPGGFTSNHLNSLFGVRCLSAANCIAAGDAGTAHVLGNEALHWNGKRWSLVHTPNPGGTSFGNFSEITALACGSPTSCSGAGSAGTNEPTQESVNQILHWNGKKWTHAVTPNPAGAGLGDINELFGAVCSSLRNCWAVGDDETNGHVFVNEALHWNGKRWSLVHTPNPGGTAMGHENVLFAARCTSSTNCWAVGAEADTTGGSANEILHWNGKRWSSFR